MSLKHTLNENLKQAMKARDVLRLSVVRMITSAIKNREIERRCELNDQEIVELLSTLAKQRRESIRLYQEGNRPDLVEKEEAELVILEEFLPAQLGQDELAALVAQVIAEIGAVGIKDMGKTMKALAPLTVGKADGKLTSEIVKQQLS